MSDSSGSNPFTLAGFAGRVFRQLEASQSNDALDREIEEIRSGHVVTQEVERAGKYALGKCKVTIESEQGYKIVMEASGCDVESFTYYDIIKDEHLLAVHREKTGDKFLLHVDAEEMRFEDNGVEETVELIPKPRKRVIRG